MRGVVAQGFHGLAGSIQIKGTELARHEALTIYNLFSAGEKARLPANARSQQKEIQTTLEHKPFSASLLSGISGTPPPAGARGVSCARDTKAVCPDCARYRQSKQKKDGSCEYIFSQTQRCTLDATLVAHWRTSTGRLHLDAIEEHAQLFQCFRVGSLFDGKHRSSSSWHPLLGTWL